jgi:hypothetical protein
MAFHVRLRTRLYWLDADAPRVHRPADGLNQIPANVHVGPKRAAECVRFLIELYYRPDFQCAQGSPLIAQEVNERDSELVTSGPNPGPNPRAYIWIWISAYKSSATGKGGKVYNRISSGKHDDQVDTLSGGLAMLAQKPNRGLYTPSKKN